MSLEGSLILLVVRHVSILMRNRTGDQTSVRTRKGTSQHGRTSGRVGTGNLEAKLQVILHDQPRASSHINDNYCVTKLQTRLLAGSTTSTETLDIYSHVNFSCWSKSRIDRCKVKRLSIKICQRCFFCHSLVLCKTCNKCQTCCTKSACRGQTPTVISCYANPHRNSYLLHALHQLIDKNTVEVVQNQTSLGFFNRLVLVPKPNNKWRHIQDLSKLNLFLKAEKFKMETPETIRTSLQQEDRSIDFKDAYFHIPIQEIPEISCPGSDIPIQSSTFWSVHSTLGVHCGGKGGETDGHAQGYKNPPVPRRLVGESHIPPGLSPAYSRSGRNMSKTGLAGEFGQIRTGAKTDLRFCRLPVRPQVRSGPTDPDWWQSLQDKVLEILSLPACPVRQFMSLIGLLTATEK